MTDCLQELLGELDRVERKTKQIADALPSRPPGARMIFLGPGFYCVGFGKHRSAV
jgi:hypothetical protein